MLKKFLGIVLTQKPLIFFECFTKLCSSSLSVYLLYVYSICVLHFRWAEKLDRLTSTATKDPEGFVGHPVNAFKLMKRLNTEWSELENLVLKDMSDGKSDGKTNEPKKKKKSIFGTTCRNAKRSDKFRSQNIKCSVL